MSDNFHLTGKLVTYNPRGQEHHVIDVSSHAQNPEDATVPNTIDTSVVTNGSDALFNSCPLRVLPVSHSIT